MSSLLILWLTSLIEICELKLVMSRENSICVKKTKKNNNRRTALMQLVVRIRFLNNYTTFQFVIKFKPLPNVTCTAGRFRSLIHGQNPSKTDCSLTLLSFNKY